MAFTKEQLAARQRERTRLLTEMCERTNSWDRARRALERATGGPLMLHERSELAELEDAGLIYAARERRAEPAPAPDRGPLPFAEAAERAEAKRLEHLARTRRAEKARTAARAVREASDRIARL